MYTGSIAAASNQATWIDTIEFVDDETDEPIDIATIFSEITMEVRDPRSLCIELTGTYTGGELTEIDDGTVQWRFTAGQMQALCPKQYEVLIRTVNVDDGDTTQTLIGTVNILRG